MASFKRGDRSAFDERTWKTGKVLYWQVTESPNDTSTYWDELDDRHALHRRGTIGIAIVIALLLVGAVVVDSSLAVYALLFTPFLALELFMVRQSRPTMKIPDYRRPPTVEVELDVHPDSSLG